MSDQSTLQIDFDDAEYTWPVGDVSGVPAEQLAPPTPPQTVIVSHVDFAEMWTAYMRLQKLIGGAADATLLDRAADEIERLRQQLTQVETQVRTRNDVIKQYERMTARPTL